MDRLKEIESRKAEIKSQIESLKDIEEVRKLNEEVDALLVEERDLKERKEERDVAEQIENGNIEVKKIEKEEEKKMEKKFDLSSKEYRSAWAKAMMGLNANIEGNYTEEEIRAVGDAIGTTATEFVAATASTQGINNLGLLIPESVRLDWLKITNEASPIYRDITKLNVDGNIDLPYLFSADDAEWYTELTDTKNEGQEYKNLKLTGHELSKAIEITWKAEAMTVDGFIDFLLQELNMKMNVAKYNAVIYGDGQDKPTGITNGLTPSTNTNAIDLIKTLLGTLSNIDRAGAKVYVANDVADSIAFYKDENGNYPYLVAGLGKANGTTIEADPFLHNGDVVVGNCKNYVLNYNQTLRVDKEIKVQPRRVVYGAYEVLDGNKKPNSFAYGKVTSEV